MSFNIKNTDSFQKGVLSTGGGGASEPTQNNEYLVWNNDNDWIVGGTESVALGANATAGNNGSIAIGKNATAGNDGSIAIGFTANAYDGSGVAIGKNANCNTDKAVVLNASTQSLTASENGFFVKTLRDLIGGNVLWYNEVSSEIVTGVSSIRYKENLEPIQGYKDLLNIEPYLFKYKDSEVTDTGLIAEHIDEYPSLRKLVYYKDYNETDEDGNAVAETKPEGVHYQKIGVFNLKLIKDLYEQDKVLTDRLKNIEEKLQ